MTSLDLDKRESQRQWNADPCGAETVKDIAPGTLEFYRAARRYRYEQYAPWLDRIVRYDDRWERDVSRSARCLAPVVIATPRSATVCPRSSCGANPGPLPECVTCAGIGIQKCHVEPDPLCRLAILRGRKRRRAFECRFGPIRWCVVVHAAH